MRDQQCVDKPHPPQAPRNTRTQKAASYPFEDDARGWLLSALAKLLVLILPGEGHHVLLKDVAPLWGVSKILHMVKRAHPAVGCWGGKKHK